MIVLIPERQPKPDCADTRNEADQTNAQPGCSEHIDSSAFRILLVPDFRAQILSSSGTSQFAQELLGERRHVRGNGVGGLGVHAATSGTVSWFAIHWRFSSRQFRLGAEPVPAKESLDRDHCEHKASQMRDGGQLPKILRKLV